MPCAGLANWTVLIQQRIQYRTEIFGLWLLFLFQIFNTGCALNGCEVSTFKKKKMNSSFDNIIKSEKPVLIDFFATWCGPCKVLGPILKEVKDNLGDGISIIKNRCQKNHPSIRCGGSHNDSFQVGNSCGEIRCFRQKRHH
jgi:thiol-disulfide isomerase/thioredoxin